MSASADFEIGARALGYYGLMASWRRRTDARWQPSVCITSSADTDEGVHTPAQSVIIGSRAGLLALREVIDEALLDAKNTPAQDSQQVLKAEPAKADATDRDAPADTSPDGGPMGAGQPAAAGSAVAWRFVLDLNTHVIREQRRDDGFDDYIASTWGGPNEERARLIAAAPELVEALRDMLAGWKYIRSMHGDLYGVGWDRAQEKAERAMEKATGRPA